MGDADVRSIDGSRWQDTLRAFVFSHLPDRPARILEVGCGKAGELALSLDAAGHEVVAVDPDAPEGAIFRRTVIEHLSEPEPFDVAVASRSLHHIADLDAALDKVVALLSPGGQVLVVEWGWDLVDDETIQWAFARMPPVEGEPVGWLQKAKTRWKEARSEEPELTFVGFVEAFALDEGFHDSRSMVAALEQRFQTASLEWGPYFFPYLVGTTEDDEMAAIARGELRATSFSYVGTCP
jgi:SAM-dependent methyltransferase